MTKQTPCGVILLLANGALAKGGALISSLRPIPSRLGVPPVRLAVQPNRTFARMMLYENTGAQTFLLSHTIFSTTVAQFFSTTFPQFIAQLSHNFQQYFHTIFSATLSLIALVLYTFAPSIALAVLCWM